MKKKRHGVRHIVAKPQGLTWMGNHYEYGQLLPRSVAAHSKFPVLLRIGYIAAADAPIVEERRITVKERKSIPDVPERTRVRKWRGFSGLRGRARRG